MASVDSPQVKSSHDAPSASFCYSQWQDFMAVPIFAIQENKICVSIRREGVTFFLKTV